MIICWLSQAVANDPEESVFQVQYLRRRLRIGGDSVYPCSRSRLVCLYRFVYYLNGSEYALAWSPAHSCYQQAPIYSFRDCPQLPRRRSSSGFNTPLVYRVGRFYLPALGPPLRSVISSRLRSLIRAMIITRSTSPEQVYVAAGANGRSRRRELTAASWSWARAWPAAGSRADHTDGDWRPAGYIGEQ